MQKKNRLDSVELTDLYVLLCDSSVMSQFQVEAIASINMSRFVIVFRGHFMGCRWTLPNDAVDSTGMHSVNFNMSNKHTTTEKKKMFHETNNNRTKPETIT